MPESQRDFAVSLLEHPTVWEIQHEVEKLHRSLPALLGVLFLTNEGGALGCSLSDTSTDAGQIIDMAAVAANYGRLVSEGFFCGSMVEATLRGNSGDLFLYSVADNGVLAFFATRRQSPGSSGGAAANSGGGAEASAIHFEGRWAAQKLAEIIAKNKRLYGH